MLRRENIVSSSVCPFSAPFFKNKTWKSAGMCGKMGKTGFEATAGLRQVLRNASNSLDSGFGVFFLFMETLYNVVKQSLYRRMRMDKRIKSGFWTGERSYMEAPLS